MRYLQRKLTGDSVDMRLVSYYFHLPGIRTVLDKYRLTLQLPAKNGKSIS